MSEDKENRRTLAKDIIAAIVTEHRDLSLEQFTGQRSLELVHLPKLERLYQTEYYPAYRDAPSPEDFRRAIRKDFDQWGKEIKDSYQAYTQAQKTPGRPISLSPSREDKDNDPRRRYLYTLFTNTLKIRFLQLTFPIMLETEAAQIITEAEGKAARMFEDWKSRKRYTLEEGNPQVLAELRHRYKQHHEKIIPPYLEFEQQTRVQLLFKIKSILREVKTGRDTRTNPAHLTNRLANRMTNAQIITYLGGLVKEPEPRKAEPERRAIKPKTEGLTVWERCMYYRYLFEAGYPTPFDNDRPKHEAYAELAERHGGAVAHWKNTWLDTDRSNRKHEGKRRKTGLKKVLKLLKEYPDAYRICAMELKKAGIL